jgi:hypothetical protein
MYISRLAKTQSFHSNLKINIFSYFQNRDFPPFLNRSPFFVAGGAKPEGGAD